MVRRRIGSRKIDLAPAFILKTARNLLTIAEGTLFNPGLQCSRLSRNFRRATTKTQRVGKKIKADVERVASVTAKRPSEMAGVSMVCSPERSCTRTKCCIKAKT